MEPITAKLTVFFEEPFWVGVFERTEGGKLSVSKVVFGAEPREFQVLEFVLKSYNTLRFSPPVKAKREKKCVNPKRIQREARKQTLTKGIGTKSQIALQLQREETKILRRTLGREQRQAEKKQKYEQKRQKRKQKHKGR